MKENSPVILALIERPGEAERILRTARRRAEHAEQQWHCIIVQKQLLDKASDQHTKSIEMLALRMGATSVRALSATDIDEFNAFYNYLTSNSRSVAEIVTGERKSISRIFGGLAYIDRIKSVLPASVVLVAVPNEYFADKRRSLNYFFASHAAQLKHFLWAIAAVVCATLIIEAIDFAIPNVIGPHNRNKSIIYLIATALVAGRLGLWPGILAAFSSFVAFNWLYSYEEMRGAVDIHFYTLNLILFILAAFIIAVFIGSSRVERDALAVRAMRLQSLLNLHNVTNKSEVLANVIDKLEQETKKILNAPVYIYLSKELNSLSEDARGKPILDSDERYARDACWREMRTTGYGTNNRYDLAWHFSPLATTAKNIGVLAVYFNPQERRATQNNDFSLTELLPSIADQIAVLVENAELGTQAANQRSVLEKEQLRSMMLSSISHDLKTPLVSIAGSLRLLENTNFALSENEKKELVVTALNETSRLKRFISNVLEMSKFEGGGLKLKKDWRNASELIGSIVTNIKNTLHHHTIEISDRTNAQPVAILIDEISIQQLFQNIIENAAHYTPHGSLISVDWWIEQNKFCCGIRDNGEGLPEDMLEKIFDKHTRITKQDHQRAGTGLGLAIARAIAVAHGGTIIAKNHPDGGAMFIITLVDWRYEPPV